MSAPCYCVLLRKTSRKLSAAYDAALAPLGINIAQFSLLRHIRRAGALSVTDLAAKVELDRSTVGRNVKVLQRMGLVAARPGADQREALLALSPEGARTLEAAEPLWDQVQADLDARLGPARMTQLQDLLAAL